MPYVNQPIQNAHFSPFMTREKSDVATRRVIIDLSWPKDASVNLGIDKYAYLATDFNLTFPTVDNITDALKCLGKGAHLYKIDMSHAFRHIKMDPSDYDLLGLRWRDVTFFDTCLPFGTRHGTQIFQCISNTVHCMMCRDGFDVINYVEDFVGSGTLSVTCGAFHLLALLRRLGLDISERKLVAPRTKVTCLGLEIDTVKRKVAIPQDKMQRIVAMVQEWKSKKILFKNTIAVPFGTSLVHV